MLKDVLYNIMEMGRVLYWGLVWQKLMQQQIMAQQQNKNKNLVNRCLSKVKLIFVY